MLVIDDIRRTPIDLPRVALTIGSFDGVHRGHRLILDTLIEAARRQNGTAAVIAMRPHPRQFFSPQNAPNLLTCDAKKVALFDEAGIDATLFLPFDAETAALDPLVFIQNILRDKCGAREVIVGHDCRFGKAAKGDFELLRREGTRCGFIAAEVPPLIVEGERISSTRVRELVIMGDLDGAEKFLGRKYSVVGQVSRGRGIGEKLGFPTANIKPHHSAVPANGVYIAEAIVRGVRLPAAVNIGIAPTIRHEDVTIEAHLLDFHEDIAGEEIEIVFHRRVRPEKKFPSYEALIAQIAADVAETRAYFPH